MEEVIISLRKLGKARTSETYATTLSSFKRFRQGKDIALKKINSDLMLEYEVYLKNKGISPNSSSFYMRILRAVYNRAVEQGLILQHHPFKYVYTGVDLFSFYTRGMSFVDMAYLRKKDQDKGVLIYRRRKTGQKLYIKWEPCMQEIIDKYDTSSSAFLLPIIKSESQTEARRQYIYSAHNINRCLKIIGKELELPLSLTLYVVT